MRRYLHGGPIRCAGGARDVCGNVGIRLTGNTLAFSCRVSEMAHEMVDVWFSVVRTDSAVPQSAKEEVVNSELVD